MKKKCCSCKQESIEFESNNNLGKVMGITNYHHIFNMEMESFWLCPACATIADTKARELIDMFKDEDITLGCILK